MTTACDKEVQPVVLTISGDVINITDTTTLADYMDALVEKGDLKYVTSDGFIKSINDVENTTNSYWMIYTSDTVNSNESWGTYTYKNVKYYSATLGISELIIQENFIYIFAYQTF
jgi:hypothetical protein